MNELIKNRINQFYKNFDFSQLSDTHIEDTLGTMVKNMTPMYQYVDLGLSVDWCVCNLGAYNITDYGKYYTWGGVEGYREEDHHVFNLKNYWDPNLQYKEDVFPADKDPVFYELHDNSYRMPTYSELNELKSLKQERTQINGVSGMMFYGKPGYENNTIFIPAAGRYNEDKCFGKGLSFIIRGLDNNTSYMASAAGLLYQVTGGPHPDATLSWFCKEQGYSIRCVHIKQKDNK